MGTIYAPLKGLVLDIGASYTVTSVDAGATVNVTISLPENEILLGIPKVYTDTAGATVKLVNGGIHEFTVEVTNGDGTAQDVVVKYDAVVYRGA